MSENKRQAISIEEIKKIIEDIKGGVDYDKIKVKYKLKNSSNVCEIWKKGDKYLAAYVNPVGSPLRKTLKSTKYMDIDKGLVNFISNYNSRGSNGYLDKFKNGHQIVFTGF